METLIIVISSVAGTIATLIVWAWVDDFIRHYRCMKRRLRELEN